MKLVMPTDKTIYPTSHDYFNGYYKMDTEKCRTLELSTREEGREGSRKRSKGIPDDEKKLSNVY